MKETAPSIKPGDVVIDKSLTYLFKVVRTSQAYATGFNILGNSNSVQIHMSLLTVISKDCPLISALCSSEAMRLNIAHLFCNNKPQQALYLGVSPRTIWRMHRAYLTI